MGDDIVVDFSTGELDDRFSWQFPPESFQYSDGKFVVVPKAESDNWCRTHYSFGVHNSAHFCYVTIPDDDRNVMVQTRVTFHAKHQFDQSGIMIRRGPDSWFKTSVEFEPHEPSHLGSVVTNKGFSDWATQPHQPENGTCALSFRVFKYKTNDFALYVNLSLNEDESAWRQIRIFHLFPLEPSDARDEGLEEGKIRVGIYCCAPIKAGYQTEYHYIHVKFPQTNPSDTDY
jgi:uncharacterized protein